MTTKTARAVATNLKFLARSVNFEIGSYCRSEQQFFHKFNNGVCEFKTFRTMVVTLMNECMMTMMVNARNIDDDDGDDDDGGGGDDDDEGSYGTDYHHHQQHNHQL